MNNTALITGASYGIGYELATLFAQDKCDLVLVARSGDRLNKIKDAFESKYSITVYVIVADLSDSEMPDKVEGYIDQKGIEISYLVNNAASGICGTYSKLSWEDEDHLLQLNLVSLCHLTKLLLPKMIQRKEGKILNVASVASFVPSPFMAIYYATKAFVLSYSEALAVELKGTGVSVTTLCPGATKTEFQAHAYKIDDIHVDGKWMDNAKKVALIGFRAMKQGRSLVIPGFKNKVLVFMVRFLPRSLVAHLVSNLHKNKTKF